MKLTLRWFLVIVTLGGLKLSCGGAIKVMLMKSSGSAVIYSMLEVWFTVRMDTLGKVMTPISQLCPL